MTVYVMGDMHGVFSPIYTVLSYMDFKKDDILCLLGDSGFNYGVKPNEKGCIDTNKSLYIKKSLNDILYQCLGFLPNIFIIHGNHEARANTVLEYEKKMWNGGSVYVQPKFPNLLFAKDGELYIIENHTFLVCGGAYSIDKEQRIHFGGHWFSDEQPDLQIQKQVLKHIHSHIDYVLTHTVPLKYVPTERLLNAFDQKKVDQSTEIFLDKLESNLDYTHWYAGHFHCDKKVNGKFDILYHSIERVGDEDEISFSK